MRTILKPNLNWLLVFVPAAVICHYAISRAETLTFILACIAVIPLAGWMGKATEHLAERTPAGIGGLLNAIFGNAAELIIAFVALHAGKTEIVKASLTGSIVGNILIVLGLSLFVGGLRHPPQTFKAAGARVQATLMTIAVVGLVAPAAFYHAIGLENRKPPENEVPLSLIIGIILLAVYVPGLLFSLQTRRRLFAGHGHSIDENLEDHYEARRAAVWPLWVTVVVLAAATALIGWMSTFLVSTVEHAAKALGMSHVFVGVIVVAVIGNAAEHSTAILMAAKNRMDLSLGIALGSSIQIALFVAPVLLIASHFVGGHPMDLVFTLPEVVAVGLAVVIANQIAGDGRTNWLQGIALLAVYAVLAVLFYFVPSSAH